MSGMKAYSRALGRVAVYAVTLAVVLSAWSPPASSQSLPQGPAGAGALAPESSDLSVVVDEVIVEGGFTELADITRDITEFFRGRRTTAGELEALALLIEQLYQQAGYMLVRVTIPPQEVVDGGPFRLLVVDGYIEAVNLDAVPAKSRRYLERLLERLVDRPRLTFAEYERAMSLARQAPGMTVRATLVPGQGVGAAVLVVEGEREAYDGSLNFSSMLSVPTPQWSAAASLHFHQPLGYGEQISLNFSAPFSTLFPQPGQRDRSLSGGATVRWPMDADGFMLQVGVSASEAYMPSPIWLIPDTRNSLRRVSVQVSKPLELTQASEVRVSATLERTDQVLDAPDFAAELTRDGLTVLRLGGSLRRDAADGGSVSLSLELSQGLSGLSRSREDVAKTGVPFSNPNMNLDFHRVLFTAQWRKPLGAGFTLTSTLRGQFTAAGPLPNSELFGGGGNSGLPGGVPSIGGGHHGWTLRQQLDREFSLFGQRLRGNVSVFLASGASQGWGSSGSMTASASGVAVSGQVGDVRVRLELNHGTSGTFAGSALEAGVEVVF